MDAKQHVLQGALPPDPHPSRLFFFFSMSSFKDISLNSGLSLLMPVRVNQKQMTAAHQHNRSQENILIEAETTSAGTNWRESCMKRVANEVQGLIMMLNHKQDLISFSESQTCRRCLNPLPHADGAVDQHFILTGTLKLLFPIFYPQLGGVALPRLLCEKVGLGECMWRINEP